MEEARRGKNDERGERENLRQKDDRGKMKDDLGEALKAEGAWGSTND